MTDLTELENNIRIIENEIELRVTEDSCTCHFRKTYYLPCKQIFKFRELKNLTLFRISLCAERWTQSYVLQHQRTFNTNKQSSLCESTLVKPQATKIDKTNKTDVKAISVTEKKN